MSLLEVCEECSGACCTGKTLVSDDERTRVVEAHGQDHFVHWARNWYYLDRGVCPYLRDGRCSVQAVKPLVCQIYPFVPRFVEGRFWLYAVGECNASPRLSASFVAAAKKLAEAFFHDCRPEEYAEFWNANKLGDFDDSKIVLRLPLFTADEEGAKARLARTAGI